MDKRKIRRWVLNPLLLACGGAVAVSGFVLQLGFHVGHHGGINHSQLVWGWNHGAWSLFHKILCVVFTVAVVLHLAVNIKWIRAVIVRHILLKQTQVCIVSVLFVLAALTGFAAWAFDGTGMHYVRKGFIEIHDKITLFLVVFLVLHVWKRFRRLV